MESSPLTAILGNDGKFKNNCDTTKKSQIVSKRPNRNVFSDLFTILILIYHMAEWIKVNRTSGQSQQDDDY